MQISCIILAAGSSRRFGSPKMRHRLKDGRTILQTTIAQYQALFEELLVVGHPKDQEHIVQTGARFVSSPSAELGISQSLIAGVTAAPAADAWLIALGDMPYLKSSTITRLVEMASPGAIAAPIHQGQQGNPVMLGREYLPEILNLEGDRGAKPLLAEHKSSLRLLEVDDIGVIHDIDTPEAILDSVHPIVI